MDKIANVQQAEKKRRRELAVMNTPGPLPSIGFKFSGLPRQPLVLFGGPKDVQHAKTDEANQVLVPISLHFDGDTHGFTLRDHFLWDKSNSRVELDVFAQLLCSEFRLHTQTALPEIIRAMKEQIEDFVDLSYIRPQLPAHGLLAPLEPQELEKIPTNSLSRDAAAATDKPQIPEIEQDFANLRVFLKIDVTIGDITLMDNVEWDINCTRNSPDLFAECLCAEMGLTSEFRVAVAHQLREQIQVYQKTLTYLDHPFDDSEIDDEDLWYKEFLPPVTEGDVRRPKDLLDFAGPTLLRGAQPSTVPSGEEKSLSTSRKRKSGASSRQRGRAHLPDRNVARFWNMATPIYRNGVKAPPVPTGPTGSGAGGSGGGAISSHSALGRRRAGRVETFNFNEDEDDDESSTDDGGAAEPQHQQQQQNRKKEEIVQATIASFKGELGRQKQETVKAWVCHNCKVSIGGTTLVRPGPTGPASLCNECGIHYSRTKQMRPLTVGGQGNIGEENDPRKKRWFQYPVVVDATRDSMK